MQSGSTLAVNVKQSIQQYFDEIEGGSIGNIYDMVLKEVERPLIESVMKFAKGNQSKAARWLGISRGKLLKLLDHYNLK